MNDSKTISERGQVLLQLVVVAMVLVAFQFKDASADPPRGRTQPVEVTNDRDDPVPSSQAGKWTVGISGAPETSKAPPRDPYFERFTVGPDDETEAVGPSRNARLALSSITLSNFDPSFPVTVSINEVKTIEEGCSGDTFEGRARGLADIIVPARETVHLPLPTPIVYGDGTFVPCIGVLVSGKGEGRVTVNLVGFLE